MTWLVACGAGPALADEGARYVPATRGGRPWVVDVLVDRAEAHGVDPGLLVRLAVCEAGPRLDPRAVGDRGTSHGLMQLSELPTGLLDHFHARGYATAYSAWESADYVARVAAGTWADEGVTLARWSCWRLVR